MCNLYTMRKSMAEVAAHFGVKTPAFSNAPEETYPGMPGVVVREKAGERVMQSMTWGFPLRLKSMSPTAKPKPVNNIADLSKNMWIGLARKPQWRCLIPVTAFAEPEGPKGAKTRTWFNVKDQPIFAWGGLWRDSAEWGPVYSGAMTDCNDAIRPVHDRMPILLMPEEYDRWLNGSFDDLLAFQARCFPDDLIEMTRTDDRWQQTESERAKAAFRAAIQGEWRVLIEDQLPDQAYALAVDGKLATFTGEAGNIEFAEAVAIASFPSGAGIHINEGLRNIKSDGEKFVAYLDPVTNETESVPIVLRHGDKVEAAGFMFRPWAVPGAS